jgi:RNA recognition motif-containing protein
VGSCELVSDKFTGQSRGFAFVEMESSAEGTQAIQRFNDFELDGRRMVVNEARPREARAGGFGAGGFGAPSGSRGPGGGAGGAGAFGAKRKSGKGSRRNARSAKRDRKACW